MCCNFLELLQKHATKSVPLKSLNKGSNCEGNIISIQEKQAKPYQYSLYKMNTNKECFIGI